MNENDGRLEYRGLRVGQQVSFRYNRLPGYSGVVQRLASSKALIRFKYHGQEKAEYISYRQIDEVQYGQEQSQAQDGLAEGPSTPGTGQ